MVAALISAGLPKERLQVRAAGQKEPASRSAESMGRAINRAVTFDWVR